jgi:hypothetical protein
LNNGFAPIRGIKHPISSYKISKSLQERQKNYGVKFLSEAIPWTLEKTSGHQSATEQTFKASTLDRLNPLSKCLPFSLSKPLK